MTRAVIRHNNSGDDNISSGSNSRQELTSWEAAGNAVPLAKGHFSKERDDVDEDVYDEDFS